MTFGICLTLCPFFRSPDLPSALSYAAALFSGFTSGTVLLPDDDTGGLLIAAGCASLLLLHWLEGLLHTRRMVLFMRRIDGLALRALFAGLALWLLLLPKATTIPFIYFRF